MVTRRTSKSKFPDYERQLRKLVAEHKKIRDEPLIWAIYYNPGRKCKDIFLFEVIENFGNGTIDPDRDLFKVTYGRASGFPLEEDQALHLVLTNPDEFQRAAQQQWKRFKELKSAVGRGDYKIVSPLKGHQNLQNLLPLKDNN